eukprot:m51a1_g12879 hypothetical protein (140) ;mRNA; r:56-649
MPGRYRNWEEDTRIGSGGLSEACAAAAGAAGFLDGSSAGRTPARASERFARTCGRSPAPAASSRTRSGPANRAISSSTSTQALLTPAAGSSSSLTTAGTCASTALLSAPRDSTLERRNSRAASRARGALCARAERATTA